MEHGPATLPGEEFKSSARLTIGERRRTTPGASSGQVHSAFGPLADESLLPGALKSFQRGRLQRTACLISSHGTYSGLIPTFTNSRVSSKILTLAITFVI